MTESFNCSIFKKGLFYFLRIFFADVIETSEGVIVYKSVELWVITAFGELNRIFPFSVIKNQWSSHGISMILFGNKQSVLFR